MTQKPLDILKEYWDYHEFRPLQEAIINSVLNKQDTFVLLPTGGGKSVCYQIPTMVSEGICLVISPLIALMKDQVNQLNTKGIKAIALDSSLSYNDIDRELNNCLYGAYRFIYMSPERLQSELVIARLGQININLIAVDEAHCISQWGNDFRPAYSLIQKIRPLLPKTPIIALTGSATPKVTNDIIENLALQNTAIFKSSFKRDNLAYMTFYTENKQGKLLRILQKNPQSSIIYVRNRAQTRQISDFLKEQDITSTHYHGGLTAKEKAIHFKEWMSNQAQVMVATNAFGMGIDKPDVKTVIHLSPTENIENYYQEAGRAGRNGKKAFAVLLYNNTDINAIQKQTLKTLPNTQEVKIIYKKLCSYLGIAYQEGEHIAYDFSVFEFCNQYSFDITKTINAITFLDRQGVLQFSKEFRNKTTLHFTVDNFNLIQYISKHKQHNTILNFIIRKYGGAFDATITIDLNYISKQLSIEKNKLKEILLAIEKNNIIELHLFDSDSTITLLEPREDDKTINRVSHYLTQQNKLKITQLKSVINYIKTDTLCKEQQLLAYFKEQDTVPCGICSFCVADKLTSQENVINLKKIILKTLKNNHFSSVELEEQLQCSKETLIDLLRIMCDNSEIIKLPNNTFKIAPKQ